MLVCGVGVCIICWQKTPQNTRILLGVPGSISTLLLLAFQHTGDECLKLKMSSPL